MLRGLDARYEAVTFRLSNGHLIYPGLGGVRFLRQDHAIVAMRSRGSAGSIARIAPCLAFDRSAVEFSGITWFWATLTSQGWERRKS